ncbi:MAG: hypothetical protein KDE51_01500 [Anaerolineales bacterium]|nr:hypothetical protein [Anaerolineales bacterium]
MATFIPFSWSSNAFSILSNLPWLEMAADVWKVSKKLWRGMADEGMYEVLEYEATLALLNKQGTLAHFHKREVVCYQQDNIIAYQDQAWGDGEILQEYACSPGTEVDRYRAGHKTLVLISLWGMKKRGETDEFHMDWKMKNGFLRNQEQWDTEINHKTKRAIIQIIFPKSRPPFKVEALEYIQQHARVLGQNEIVQRSDGKWVVRWEIEKPRLHEHYILKWSW